MLTAGQPPTRSQKQSGTLLTNLWLPVYTACSRGLTAHAGLVQRGCRVQGRVDLGPVGEQELHALDAA